MLRLIYIFLVLVFIVVSGYSGETSASQVVTNSATEEQGVRVTGGEGDKDADIVSRGECTPPANLLYSGEIALEDGFGAIAEKSFLALLNAGCSLTNGVLSDVDKAASDGLLRALILQEKHAELLERVDLLVKAESIDNDGAVYWRALVCFRESKYTEVIDLLDPFQKNIPKGVFGESMLRLLALARLKSGDVAGAIDCFELFAKNYPNSGGVSINRLDWGKALVFQGEFKAAVDILMPVLGDVDLNLSNNARYWIGRAYLQLGKAEEGVTVLEPLLADEIIAEDLRVNAVLAVVGSRSVGGLKSEGEDWNMHLKRDVDLLTNTLSRVSGEESKRKLSFEICRILLDGGRLDDAAPIVKAYVSANSDAVTSAALQLQLGDALLSAGRNEEAVSVYQQYLEIFVNAGGQADARLGSGWALIGVERYAEAALAFEKAYDLFEEPEQKMECLFKVGDALFLNTQYKKALSIYERFLKEFPESKFSAKAMFQIGACLVFLGENEEAERRLEFVVSQHKGSLESGEALLRIGELRESLGDWKGAEALYERMMKLYPDGQFFIKALRGRGMARYKQWSPNALEDFERVVQEFPDSDDAEYSFFMRAMCLYRLGRDKPALEICQEFMASYKDSEWAPVVRFWIGRFAYNSGDYESAEVEFMAFIEQYPEHDLADSAVFRAGMTALKRKEYVHAIELFGILVKSYPKSKYLAEARFRQADAMSQLGKFSGAILVFDEVINGFPENSLVALAWGRKGDCQFTLGAEDSERYKEAVRSYRVVTQSPGARWDRVLQAEYKIALSFEKLESKDDALDHYYSKVMVPFLMERERGSVISDSAKIWFTRGALAASEIVTEKKDWRQLVRILNRIVEADVAISSDAKKRITEIESDKWWLFY